MENRFSCRWIIPNFDKSFAENFPLKERIESKKFKVIVNYNSFIW